MPPVTLHAPAKLNLVLSVGRPERPPSPHAGWHPIASWMVPIDLCDEVEAQPLVSGTPSALDIAFADDAPRPEPITWPRESDLAWRALGALESHAARPLPTRLRITKRIPTGAGLGGGSSDAASALIAISRAHDLGLSADTLQSIGRTLGSDVPFFIDPEFTRASRPAPRPALVSGFGDRVERLAPLHAELVLIIPPFGCSTPDVYRAFDALPAGALNERRVRDIAAAHALDPLSLFNDLSNAACAVAPDLARLVAHAAAASELPVHITGSGSAMFIITPPERANTLARHLAADPLLTGCAILPTHTAR